MTIKERENYVFIIINIYLGVFTLLGGFLLIVGIVETASALVAEGEIIPALSVFLYRFLHAFFGSLLTGWIISGIPGGILFLPEYLKDKGFKLNFLSVLLFLVLIIPVSLLVSTPFALYSAIKYKIPIKIEFISAKKLREREESERTK